MVGLKLSFSKNILEYFNVHNKYQTYVFETYLFITKNIICLWIKTWSIFVHMEAITYIQYYIIEYNTIETTKK